MERRYRFVLFFLVLLSTNNSYTMGLDEDFGVSDLNYDDYAKNKELSAPEQNPLDAIIDNLRADTKLAQKKLEPALSLYFCKICDAPTARMCPRCQGIYYCNAEHQKDDWPKHKQVCKIIAQAHVGHIQQLYNFYRASVTAAHRLKTEESYRQVVGWHEKFLLRLQQDADCSANQSLREAYENIKLQELNVLTDLTIDIRVNAISEIAKAATHAYKWAWKLILSETLVPPHGIERYLKGDFSKYIDMPQEPDALLDAKKWKVKRVKRLQIFGNNVAKYKEYNG